MTGWKRTLLECPLLWRSSPWPAWWRKRTWLNLKCMAFPPLWTPLSSRSSWNITTNFTVPASCVIAKLNATLRWQVPSFLFKSLKRIDKLYFLKIIGCGKKDICAFNEVCVDDVNSPQGYVCRPRKYKFISFLNLFPPLFYVWWITVVYQFGFRLPLKISATIVAGTRLVTFNSLILTWKPRIWPMRDTRFIAQIEELWGPSTTKDWNTQGLECWPSTTNAAVFHLRTP